MSDETVEPCTFTLSSSLLSATSNLCCLSLKEKIKSYIGLVLAPFNHENYDFWTFAMIVLTVSRISKNLQVISDKMYALLLFWSNYY